MLAFCRATTDVNHEVFSVGPFDYKGFGGCLSSIGLQLERILRAQVVLGTNKG